MARHDALDQPDQGSDLSPAYLRVLVIEALVIAALYAIGRHFA